MESISQIEILAEVVHVAVDMSSDVRSLLVYLDGLVSINSQEEFSNER